MSGWTNQGVTTLVVPTGATTGARVVIDGTTGLISVYNSNNVLVGQWGGTNGCLFVYPTVLQTFVEICDGAIKWNAASGGQAINPPVIQSNGVNAGGTNLFLDSGYWAAGGFDSWISLFGGSNAAGSELRCHQRNVTGDVVQTDTGGNNTNQLVHMGHYTGTTGPSGAHTLGNAATFNIAGAVVLFDQTLAAAGVWCSGAYNFGGTSLNTQWLIGSGGGVSTFNNGGIAANYLCWG